MQEGKPVRADIDGKAIVLALVSGKVYAMNAVCSHEGGPLEGGSIEGYSLICPWLQGIFGIRTAKASPKIDWVTDLHSYAVVIDDKSGQISIGTDSNSLHSDNSNQSTSQQKVAMVDDAVPPRPLNFN